MRSQRKSFAQKEQTTYMNRITTLACTTLLLACISTAQHMQMNARYSGPTYDGAPMLKVTASLVMAGGGPGNFSTAKAVTAIAGKDLTNKEIAKLTQQYGQDKVGDWIKVNDFAVADALKIATAAGVKLPKGSVPTKKLGATLLKMGIANDQTYYVELMLDKLLSNKIHDQVMDDIDAKFGEPADANYHRISNQAYYDLAMAMKMKKVKLAEFH